MIVTITDANAVVWTKPEDLDVQLTGYQQRLTAGVDGFPVAFCDGSIRWIPTSIAPDILNLLIDPSDGKPVPNF